MPTPNVDSLGVSKDKAAEIGQKVTDRIDENRGAAASGLESAASALREKADTLPGGAAATKFKGILSEVVPGFTEHLAKAEADRGRESTH